MKQKWIKHAGYVWQQFTALSIVAGKLNNYCYLLVVASNGNIINVTQNLYCNATDDLDHQKLVARMTGNILPMMLVAVTNWFLLYK